MGWQQSFTQTELVKNRTALSTNDFESTSFKAADFRLRRLRQWIDQLAKDWEGHGDNKQSSDVHFSTILYSFLTFQ